LRAKVHGTKNGRPIGRPTVDTETASAISKSPRKGIGIRKTATRLEVGTETVQKTKAELSV
jgi:cystathionine beta-lyase/cystathionine gamma-synthase